MSYDSKKSELGREPIQIIEIDSGICEHVFGSSPCTASASPGGECYNTRKTCQDPSNYSEITRTDRLCQSRSNLPIGINMIPSVIGNVARAPVTITIGKGLGNRAAVKINLKDHTWSDHDTDPYVDTRAYTPEETGTYWGKWLARNPYWEGRSLRILTGYIGSPFSWSDFQTEHYDISDIAGPTNGQVTITAKDVLTRTYGRKAQYPAASTGELAADITAGASSATLSPAGIGNEEYPSSGTIAIGKEAITFTRSGDTLTLTARGQWGTEAKAHSEGDTVQVCAVWEEVIVTDVLKELLVTGAGVPSAYIPDGTGENWDVEEGRWLQSALVNGILLKPEKIDKVINELLEQFMIDMWWSSVDQEVKIKVLAPEFLGAAVDTLNDNEHLLADSIKIQKDSKKRLSEVRVYFNKIDYSEKDDPEEFSSLYVKTNIESAGSTQYGSDAIKTINARWIRDKGLAGALANRLLARYVDTPIEAEFQIDIKDEESAEIGERVELSTKHIQGVSGAPEPVKVQVTKVLEPQIGSTLKIQALESVFRGRYGFIAPDGLSVYSLESETNQSRYGFICYDTGVFSDGEEAYKII